MHRDTKQTKENVKGRDHLRKQGVDRKMISKWILKKYNRRMWTGLVWFKGVTSGGLFWRR